MVGSHQGRKYAGLTCAIILLEKRSKIENQIDTKNSRRSTRRRHGGHLHRSLTQGQQEICKFVE